MSQTSDTNWEQAPGDTSKKGKKQTNIWQLIGNQKKRVWLVADPECEYFEKKKKLWGDYLMGSIFFTCQNQNLWSIRSCHFHDLSPGITNEVVPTTLFHLEFVSYQKKQIWADEVCL